MNKSDVVDRMAKASNITKSAAEKALNEFINCVVDSAKSNDKLVLVGFGTFSVYERKERNGRNPKTGELIKIESKKVLKFKPGAKLESIA